MRKDDPLNLDNFWHFFDDNFFDRNLDNLDDLLYCCLRWLWCRRHRCRRWSFLQWDCRGYAIIWVWPRVGDDGRVRSVAEESLSGRCAANNEMEGSKNRPL